MGGGGYGIVHQSLSNCDVFREGVGGANRMAFSKPAVLNMNLKRVRDHEDSPCPQTPPPKAPVVQPHTGIHGPTSLPIHTSFFFA